MKSLSLPSGSERLGRAIRLSGYIVLAVALGVAGYFASRFLFAPELPVNSSAVAPDHGEGEEPPPGTVILPKEQWPSAELQIAPAKVGTFRESKWVTGKVIVNRDQAAEIYPLVEGRVHHVNVGFGEQVEDGQVLAVIDSQPVGEAKLALFADRQDERFAQVNYEWAQKINENAQALIAALRGQPPLNQAQEQFEGRPMGEYREQLMTAYASLYETRLAYERLRPLAESGAAAGRQAIEARAGYEAAQARMKALLEQIQFTAEQQALRARQALEKARTQVGVSRSSLFLLGYREQDLANIDPMAEGEEIAHYPIKSPLSGTVIEKEVVVGERVGPETRMFEIADLTSVWIQADIYQRDLPLLADLGETLIFRSKPYDHTHEAEIFYTGDIVDPETRTVRLMAVAPNPNRHLKPGMFVQVRLPGQEIPDVLQVPLSAIQRQEDEQFVFVHRGGEIFQRRDVVVGSTSEETAVIREGLQPGEPVVVQGGLALKANLLSEMVGGSHAH